MKGVRKSIKSCICHDQNVSDTLQWTIQLQQCGDDDVAQMRMNALQASTPFIFERNVRIKMQPFANKINIISLYNRMLSSMVGM